MPCIYSCTCDVQSTQGPLHKNNERHNQLQFHTCMQSKLKKKGKIYKDSVVTSTDKRNPFKASLASPVGFIY